ncbi:MAG: peptidylprolyl isomerase [Bacteroidota bacterium]
MRKTVCFLLIVSVIACQRPAFKEKWLSQQAPAQFNMLFETSRGNFEAAFTREWSPLAVDRLYAQVKHGYYSHTLFYRVRPGYVAQFGGDDSARMANWKKSKVPDEPVIHPNMRGTISFARGGKESRGNDLYINLNNNNPRLDTLQVNGVKGYPVLGMITKGIEVIDSLYSGYGDGVFKDYDLLFRNKQAFIAKYPKLDLLIKVSVKNKRN